MVPLSVILIVLDRDFKVTIFCDFKYLRNDRDRVTIESLDGLL